MWMGLAAFNNLVAVAVLIFVTVIDPGLAAANTLRFAAQLQLAHGMATVSCATFMNIEAVAARRAPAFFLGGGVPLSTVMYICPECTDPIYRAGQLIAIFVVLTGWIVLAASTFGMGNNSKYQ
ncbi:hypothetical protein [Sphingomonas fennica]|uniref:hypothetical protein n=1 Tax=Edaphosphingomonas fennica TaxID=114404 RepID=UPI0011B29346|nr:hypothetical protein [Sphingomonas fennica]